MNQYPMQFSSQTHANGDFSQPWVSHGHEGDLRIAIPPEFEGPGGGFSPEDLLGVSALNCFIATFKVIAKNSNLEFDSIDGKTELTLDKNDQDGLFLEKIRLSVNVNGCTDPEKSHRILEKTADTCMIMKALNAKKEYCWHVSCLEDTAKPGDVQFF